LLAIADLRDDPWPQTARMGASLLLGSDEDPSLGVRLLSDIRDVFARCGADRLTSEMLCSKLIALEDRPWGECHKGGAITQTRLAAMLEPYGVKPNSVRFPAIGGTRKGYLLDWFNDPFARYLPPYPPQAGTPEQTNDCRGLEAA